MTEAVTRIGPGHFGLKLLGEEGGSACRCRVTERHSAPRKRSQKVKRPPITGAKLLSYL